MAREVLEMSDEQKKHRIIDLTLEVEKLKREKAQLRKRGDELQARLDEWETEALEFTASDE